MEHPDARLFSSDEYRERLCSGNHSGHANNVVFDAMHKDVRVAIKDGVTIIYDATNLSKRRRIAVLQMVGAEYEKICVCMLVPVKTCMANDSARTGSVGSEVIEKFYKSFQPPHMAEGWDRINLCGIKADRDAGEICEDFKVLLKKAMFFDQHNHWHEYSLGEHLERTLLLATALGDGETMVAAQYHDIGKPLVVTEGEDGEWHYYGHANVGAYEFLLWMYARAFVKGIPLTEMKFALEVATLICYHMAPMNWKDGSKGADKIRKLLGEDTYKRLCVLYRCDQMSHGDLREVIRRANV